MSALLEPGQLSKNFWRAEFSCRCGCGFGLKDGDVSLTLVRELQRLRDIAGVPVKVTSGCRCKEHNARVGGASKSQHLYGNAADIKVNGYSVDQMYALVKEFAPGLRGVGLYRSWVHVDVRQKPWFRDYRK